MLAMQIFALRKVMSFGMTPFNLPSLARTRFSLPSASIRWYSRLL